MKRVSAILLALMLMIMVSACGDTKAEDSTDETSAETAAETVSYDELTEHIETVLRDEDYDGIVYLTHNGNVVYKRAVGEDEEGEPLTVDTTLFIGSTSKQFCAASVMFLRDDGKLSVDDTIDRYFPEYDEGKNITVKNLLTMRSGIPDMVNDGNVEDISADNTEEENVAVIKKWIFSQPLKFDPDSKYAYSNSNFFLLADIVEQVSGKYYNDFVRENILDPLGMTHTGFITEIGDSPAWAEHLVHDDTVPEVQVKGIAKGAGDILTNAPDMAKWMEGLIGGKVVGMDTYREMTTDYSPESGESYGYGLMPMFAGGAGHPGRIGFYSAAEYFNPELGYCLFCDSNNCISDDLPTLLLSDYLAG